MNLVFSVFFLYLLKFEPVFSGVTEQNTQSYIKKYRQDLEVQQELLGDETIRMTPEEISKLEPTINGKHTGEDKTDYRRYICWGYSAVATSKKQDEEITLLNGMKNIAENYGTELDDPLFNKMKIGHCQFRQNKEHVWYKVILEFERLITSGNSYRS